jgi:tetratricopeptide (TPR) repeat protein
MTAIRPNLLKLLVPLAAFATTLILLVALGGSDEVEPPRSAGGIEISVPPGASTDQRIAIFQRAVRDGIGGADGYALLGGAYLQKNRENGDPSYYSRAERSFDAALRRDPRNLNAVLGAGTLAGARHDFREQLRRGLEAHRLEPELAAPYTVISDGQIELGRYRAAARTIQRMVDLRPDLASYARAAYYLELRGDLGEAVRVMRMAASAGADVPENVAYVQTLLGDLELQRGRLESARSAYRGALARLPGYGRAEAGLARVDNARGDLASAARRLRRVAQRLPLTPFLVLLAETDLALGGDARAADLDLDVVRTQQRLLAAAGARPDAELVLFEANHGDPPAAVRLGRRLWADAPSVRSADALGLALTRAGRPAEGLTWARRALRLGSRDPLFHLHAGLAAKGAGRPGVAARELRTALAGRAALSPLRAREARAALEGLR